MEATIMENQMEKKMENEMETGIIISQTFLSEFLAFSSVAKCSLFVFFSGQNCSMKHVMRCSHSPEETGKAGLAMTGWTCVTWVNQAVVRFQHDVVGCLYPGTDCVSVQESELSCQKIHM